MTACAAACRTTCGQTRNLMLSMSSITSSSKGIDSKMVDDKCFARRKAEMSGVFLTFFRLLGRNELSTSRV